MVFHIYDGDGWEQSASIEEAKTTCDEALKVAREEARSFGEWPDWVEHIASFVGPADAEDPSELPCVLKATAINVKRPSSELDKDGYDSEGNFWGSADAFECDYAICHSEPVIENNQQVKGLTS